MIDTEFITQVDTLSSQSIELCYHCHKCTAGCPVAMEMEFGPDQALRMAQMGEKDLLLQSQDIWLCAGCETCGARCPNEIDIARVMDALRSIAMEEKVPLGGPWATKFNSLFLTFVENTGRMYEAGLLGLYKVLTLNLIADMDSGAKMFVNGKVPLLPHFVKNRREVKQLFIESAKHARGER